MVTVAEYRQMLEQEEKRSKYGNKKTTVDGITYDSKLEANYGQELMLLEPSGFVRNIRRQVEYILRQGFITESLKKVSSVRYFADFVYEEKTKDGWKEVVVDCKGYLTATYKSKRSLMKKVHGIKIKEVAR
jgi:hypothetical protein